MSDEKSVKPSPWPWVIGVAIICLTVVILFVFNQAAAFETLRLTTEKGSAEESPLNSILQSQLGFIGAFVGTIIAAGLGGYKLYKKLSVTENVIEKIKVQTNGRAHVRDHQIDTLVEALNLAIGRETPAFDPTHPPEANYTKKEMSLNSALIEIIRQASEERKEKNNGN